MLPEVINTMFLHTFGSTATWGQFRGSQIIANNFGVISRADIERMDCT